MSPGPHAERHFTASETVRDVVIGMSDGLTVPFALAAGLSGAVANTGVVVTAGLAEIAAGAIAMGLGGYLAARTDDQHYQAEYARELRETHEMPREELAEVRHIFMEHGLTGQALDLSVAAITSDRARWVDFMMRFELNLEKPDAKRAPVSAATIGGSYLIGGLVPLLPYMLTSDMSRGFLGSTAMTLTALMLFGAIKGRLTGTRPFAAGLQTLCIGGLAAAAAYALAKLVS
ncbi:MAG TPA: VIT1/CCC1 transporter family protein [Stellaceae bacterium]|nr:VIT1/CCC1 transporter family protein [Stellaceae bacterium]